MKTTKDYLAAVRARVAAEGVNPSKYRIGKVLGVSPETVGNWESGRSMDDDSAARVAAYLGEPEAEVLIAMARERARTPTARIAWEKVAAKVAQGAALAVLVVAGYALSPDNLIQGAAASALPNDLYYVKSGALLFALISSAYLYLSRPRIQDSPTVAR